MHAVTIINFNFMDRRTRQFYHAFVDTMLKKFPFNNQTLKDLLVLNPDKKESVSISAGMHA